MSSPIEKILEQASKVSRFPSNSRYYGSETATFERSDGTVVSYLKRRFIPPEEDFSLLQEHSLTEGDRLDNLSAGYFGDPELFWRICDANSVMNPDDLTETPGRKIRITLPAGIPGSTDE